MEPFKDPLGKKERWVLQDPKVTGALLGHQVIVGHLALEGTREKKETKVTKSMLGGEGEEVLLSSHELAMAGQLLDQVSSCIWHLGPSSLEGESWSLSMSY